MKTWTIDLNGTGYDCTDYGPKFGLKVERRGFTVLTGFFVGSQVVVDSTQLAGATLAHLLDLIAATHPGRKQGALFAGMGKAEAVYQAPKKKPAAKEQVQIDMFGGAPVVSSERTARKMERGELDAGPLFRWAAR